MSASAQDSFEHPSTSTATGQRPAFVTTQWSVVLRAGTADTEQSREALEKLCRAYWFPLYAYARRMGQSAPDAQDLTQEFFARLLAKNYLAAAERTKGRFRSFLLTAFKRFMCDEWDRFRAQKRGGGQTILSLDATGAEARYGNEPMEEMASDRAFERRWALTLLEEVMRRLEEDNLKSGKAREFQQLKPYLTAQGGEGYREAAEKLGMTEGALRVAIHRLRRRYRELFREEIEQTVETPAEAEAEIRHLLEVLSQ